MDAVGLMGLNLGLMGLDLGLIGIMVRASAL